MRNFMISRRTGLPSLHFWLIIIGVFFLLPGVIRSAADRPFAELLREPVQLKKELVGVHPRVFLTEADLASYRKAARGERAAMWKEATEPLVAMKGSPPAPTPEERRSQNDVAHAITQISLAYAIEKKPEYLEAARKWILTACRYDPWGYSNNKPNVDLAAGHLLYAIGWGYDLLYSDLTPEERRIIREKLILQSRLLYDYYAYKSGKRYSFSQNHTFIPMTGLMVASFALMGEAPEADQWARLAHAIYDRVLSTYGEDGYYYEGFEYWVFATPWIIHYLDAVKQSTGEDLFDQPGLRKSALYFMHSLLPGAGYVFDFGDIYEGPLTRAGIGEEAQRAMPGGRLHSNYHLLYRLASRFQDPLAQTVAQFARDHQHVNMENIWTFLWYDPKVQTLPLSQIPTWHHFTNAGVVYWRSGWDADATAVAFKCGPPEGHKAAAQLKSYPEWRLSTGHAHPDANSFILFAHGRYLSGDTGYSGITLTAHHNTLLVDGKGQQEDGRHEVFDGVPYDRLNEIQIVNLQADAKSMTVVGEAVAAYDPALGLKSFRRELRVLSPDHLEVTDTLQAATPRSFTLLFHADKNVDITADRIFAITSAPVRAEVAVKQPEKFELSIQPNWVMAPGAPGSIETGEKQNRNPRVHLTLPASNGTAVITDWKLIKKQP
jgi:hypothetical protein